MGEEGGGGDAGIDEERARKMKESERGKDVVDLYMPDR